MIPSSLPSLSKIYALNFAVHSSKTAYCVRSPNHAPTNSSGALPPNQPFRPLAKSHHTISSGALPPNQLFRPLAKPHPCKFQRCTSTKSTISSARQFLSHKFQRCTSTKSTISSARQTTPLQIPAVHFHQISHFVRSPNHAPTIPAVQTHKKSKIVRPTAKSAQH